jgi:acetyl-CoA carboxylase biotin carboxylase subunit
MFKKVLIANRGEIAVRIVRACRDVGIRSVAVYSEADRTSLHVRLADEARCVGPAPSSESYLRSEAILQAAKDTGAEAVHPGYGFLAENAEFARECGDAGLIFIGPSPEAMRLMGDKAQARATAERVGVPVVPGTAPIDNVDDALEAANKIGFPLLVKATAGGGGKGMRHVGSENELAGAIQQASSEAASSFGNPAVFLEKFIDRPRHIELQIVADRHGNTIHLLERECSIQRRHQKLIEEAPSPFVDDELRQRMGDAAVSLASAANYENAGTVEFLVDAERNFYFLEMNARLQVEHPVTELVTGIDLVALQFHIASGAKLPFVQKDIVARGWAMELRITAEDPFENFLPSSGRIDFLRAAEGPGIRHDSGVYAGWEVTPHYDPLIAKLVVAGDDRRHVLQRARRAVREYQIDGIATTLPFFERMLDDERFAAGDMDVSFVDRHWMSEMVNAPTPRRSELLPAALAAAAVARQASAASQNQRGTDASRPTTSAWKRLGRSQQMGDRF